jgi:hypothetical protein
MLLSVLVLVAVLFSNGMPLLTAKETASEAVSPLLRPEDPSTLTLALIGAGTMAIYLAVRRAPRSRIAVFRKVEVPTGSAIEVPTKTPASAQPEQPSRGAA